MIFKKPNTSKILGSCMKQKFKGSSGNKIRVLWCLKKKNLVSQKVFLPLPTHLPYFSPSFLQWLIKSYTV